MNKVINWFTRRKVLIVGVVGSIVFFLSLYLDRMRVCKTLDIYSSETICTYASVVSIISLAILIFSIILFFIKKESVFRAWKWFTFTYLLIYLFIVIITPWYAGDSRGFFSFSFKLKIFSAFVFTVLYIFISLVIIIYQSLKKNKI